MAEFVQLRKEKWTEPILSLIKLDLLPPADVQSIVKKIDNFEHKIQSPNRELKDVLAYVQYECYLLKKIQRVREEKRQYEQTDEIDRFIYNEIQGQFGSALLSFQHQIEYWNARLKFIANIVPEQDRESEFNRIFKLALDYCGRGNLDLYKYCVRFLWSLLKTPFVGGMVPGKKRKKPRRKDCSRLIISIREITTSALRTFSRSLEAMIWVLTTELKYLTVLNEERQVREEEHATYISFSIELETEKTEKLVNVLYESLISKHATGSAFIDFYNAVGEFDIPQAYQLRKKLHQKILSVQPRTPNIFLFLISKSFSQDEYDEAMERINQALSSNSTSKTEMFIMAIKEVDASLDKLMAQKAVYNMKKLLPFYMSVFDNKISNWKHISSDIYHSSRIRFIKRLPQIISLLPSESEEHNTLTSFMNSHSLDTLVKESLKEFPSNFSLVKERILFLLSLKDTNTLDVTKAGAICTRLSKINWDQVDVEEGRKLVTIVYYSFAACNKNMKVDKLLKMSDRIPGIADLRVVQLRTSYMAGVKVGRQFYKEYKPLTSNWKFPAAVVEIETVFCRVSKLYSNVLRDALQNVVRLGGVTATEPWRICVMCHFTMKNDVEASRLIDRALKVFSAKVESDDYKQMLMFAQFYKGSKTGVV